MLKSAFIFLYCPIWLVLLLNTMYQRGEKKTKRIYHTNLSVCKSILADKDLICLSKNMLYCHIWYLYDSQVRVLQKPLCPANTSSWAEEIILCFNTSAAWLMIRDMCFFNFFKLLWMNHWLTSMYSGKIVCQLHCAIVVHPPGIFSVISVKVNSLIAARAELQDPLCCCADWNLSWNGWKQKSSPGAGSHNGFWLRRTAEFGKRLSLFEKLCTALPRNVASIQAA